MTTETSRRGSARRAQVLDGLVEVFLAEGFAGFSLEELAARLRCSKTTLYAVAASKEQLISVVVREFFRRSTARVEERLAGASDPVVRIRTYLEAISEELAPASPAFFADLAAFAPAREVYQRNTAIAAERVQALVADAARPGSGVDARFVGAVAGVVMAAIQSGDLAAATSLTDAAAYRRLADLVVAGAAGAERTS